jgi:large subunit ribosomal protein L17
MRHQVAFRKLQRDTPHRMAMLKNMVTSLLEHERITTTVPKAKEARRIAEHVITLGKKGGLPNVRLAGRTVQRRDVLEKVFGELKDRYAKRPGGYTRIVRIGQRRGDAAEMALLELVDRPAKAEGDGETKAKPDAKADAPAAEPKKAAAKKEKAPKAEKSKAAEGGEAPKKAKAKKKAE